MSKKTDFDLALESWLAVASSASSSRDSRSSIGSNSVAEIPLEIPSSPEILHEPEKAHELRVERVPSDTSEIMDFGDYIVPYLERNDLKMKCISDNLVVPIVDCQ